MKAHAPSRPTIRLASFLCGFALALAVPATPALAAGPEEAVMVDILPGWRTADGKRMAALRLDLAPGWKTYWRSPGEAGLPPQFDWSGSTNLRSVRLHWPAPEVFETNGMRTIGYHDLLILPVEIEAKDPSKPVRLSARMLLGVCRDICVPATLDVSRDLTAPGSPDAEIRAALAERPATAREAGVKGLHCEVEPIRDGLRLTARMTLAARGDRETVAVELADPRIWVSETVTQRRGSELVTTAELVPPQAAPFALDRSEILLTVIGSGGAVEIRGCPGG